MRRNLKFALVYTAVLTVPLAMVLGAMVAVQGELDEFVGAFKAHGGVLFWPLLLLWPWAFVLAGVEPGRSRGPAGDD